MVFSESGQVGEPAGRLLTSPKVGLPPLHCADPDLRVTTSGRLVEALPDKVANSLVDWPLLIRSFPMSRGFLPSPPGHGRGYRKARCRMPSAIRERSRKDGRSGCSRGSGTGCADYRFYRSERDVLRSGRQSLSREFVVAAAGVAPTASESRVLSSVCDCDSSDRPCRLSRFRDRKRGGRITASTRWCCGKHAAVEVSNLPTLPTRRRRSKHCPKHCS